MVQIRVLVIESNPQDRREIACALRGGRRKVSVTSASTGTEALRRIAAGAFDCVLVRDELPDCSIQVLLERALAPLNGCPVVVYSSCPHQQPVIQSMRWGASDFLPRDEVVNAPALWRRLSNVIAASRHRRADRRRNDRRLHQLIRLSETDPLTGVYNRRYFDRLMHDDRRGLDRRGRAACAMVDIDRFKDINDRFGHVVGDAVLRLMAHGLRAAGQSADVIARWGGDEFLMVRAVASVTEAWRWAEALRRHADAVTIDVGAVRVPLTITVGVAAGEGAGFTTDLIEAADRAMLLAKRRGRNRVGTQRLVSVDGTLTALARRRGMPLDQRLMLFIAQQRPHLGPAQLERLTTHSQAVAAIAGRLARRLNLAPDRQRQFHLAGLCHDLAVALAPEELVAHEHGLDDDHRSLWSWCAAESGWMASRLGLSAEAVQWIDAHSRANDGAVPRQAVPDATGPAGDILSAADLVATLAAPPGADRRLESAAAPWRRPLAALDRFHPGIRQAVAELEPEYVSALVRGHNTLRLAA